MKAFRLLPLVLGLTIAGSAFADKARSVNELIHEATTTAKAGHKGILMIFHASWCGWCHQLDKTLDVPAMKDVMDRNFVVLHVTVQEDADHKADENPGGASMLKQLGGDGQGIPYFATLTSQGTVVANSKVTEQGKLQNMGFPTEAVEIQHFKEMLKLAKPDISDADLATVDQVLVARAKEIKH